MRAITVSKYDAGMRLDKYLKRYFDLAPGSFVYKNLRKKNIKLNGSRAAGTETIAPGDEIELFFSESTLDSLSSACAGADEAGHAGAAENLEIGDFCGIVYEDEYIIIADKKAGVLSQKAHPGDVSLNEVLRAYTGTGQESAQPVVDTVSPRAQEEDLVPRDRGFLSEGIAPAARDSGREGNPRREPAWQRHCEDPEEPDAQRISGRPEVGECSSATLTRPPAMLPQSTPSPQAPHTAFRPSVMNRLDRNTSGLITFAKTYSAASELSRIFRSGSVEKYYLAVVEGIFNESIKATDGWLIKDRATNTVRILDHEAPGAARIHTGYEVLETFERAEGRFTLLKIRLFSGKTHQIRASLSSLGHPVLGDKKYGGSCPAAKNRLFLHSYELVLPKDMGEPLGYLSGRSFRTGPPEYFYLSH